MNIFILKTNIANYDATLKLDMNAEKRGDRKIAGRSDPEPSVS
jgi:hypothetical protein